MADSSSEVPDLKAKLKKLDQISAWFESQKDLDIEEGIKKVKQAAELIRSAKARLQAIENEFQEIKKDIEKEVEGV